MLQQQNPDLIGSAPALSQLTDFVYQEAGASYASNPGSLTQAKTDAIKLSTIRQLTKRKIYLWLWADLSGTFSTTPFYVAASLKFYFQQSVIASIPVNIGITSTAFSGATPYTQSLVTACTAGGNVTGDSIGLYVCNPVSPASGQQPQYVILQPQYITGEMDEVRLSIDYVHANVVNIRAWLGVMSSQ